MIVGICIDSCPQVTRVFSEVFQVQKLCKGVKKHLKNGLNNYFFGFFEGDAFAPVSLSPGSATML